MEIATIVLSGIASPTFPLRRYMEDKVICPKCGGETKLKEKAIRHTFVMPIDIYWCEKCRLNIPSMGEIEAMPFSL